MIRDRVAEVFALIILAACAYLFLHVLAAQQAEWEARNQEHLRIHYRGAK